MNTFLLIALILAIFGTIAGSNGLVEKSNGKQIMSNDETTKEQQFGRDVKDEKKFEFILKSSFKTPNPNKEFRKTVSFNDVPDFKSYPSTQSDGIFWINEMKFQRKVQQKSNTFNKSSKKRKFIDLMANVLGKNFRMMAQIYIFVIKFDGYDIILSQTKMPSSDKMFPNSETIGKLEKTKEDFREKLIKLFYLIEPASKVNKDLSIIIDLVDAKAKINQNQLDKLKEESKKVDNIFKRFENGLKDFKIGLYKKYLSNIRVMVNKFEDRVLNQFDVALSSQENLIELGKLCPKMDKSLDALMEINFTELEETMKKIHGLAKIALNIKDTCKFPNDTKKGKKINWTFGIPICMK